MAGRHERLGVGIGFVRPLRQNFPGQLPHLLADTFLGLVGGAIVTHGLIQRVGQLMQAGEHIRPMGQSLFQRTP